MSYPGYAVYKESGVEWLGEIPAEWNSPRLRFLARVNPSKSEVHLSEDEFVSFVPMESVGEYGGLNLDDARPFDEIGSGYTYFADGDVVVAKITPCFENGKGALAENLSNGTAFGTTELHVLRPGDELNRHFLFYLTISYPFRKMGEAFMYGAAGQKRVPENFIRDLRAGIPPLPEQQAIARFLDYKTAQIDALIAKKEALLAKLAEKRTALISQAVTKGLDPHAPMKDSGVEWLGEIPAHWEVKRFKHLLSEPLKYGANEAAEQDDPDQPRYIRITDVTESGALREDTFRSLPYEVALPYLLRDGDILLARSGATVGKSFIYRDSWGTAAYAGYLIRARTSPELSSGFAYQFLQSVLYWEWLKSIFIQSTIQNVSAEKYANLCFPVPPVGEQSTIEQHVDAQTGRITKHADRIQLAIDKLNEYRTSLITHAVTGKIDVRDFVPPEPSS